jgi:hypothetical protein
MDEANLRILNQIGDHADDTGIYSSTRSAGNESDDSDNELLPPKNAVIPEPDDIDAPAEDDDLLIDASTVLTQSAEYKRKHFSNTSDSSDSDDSITRGLDFKNIPVTATIEPHSSSNILTNIQQTLARNLIQNVLMPTAVKSSQSNDSEDEISDFEILDKDDLMK